MAATVDAEGGLALYVDGKQVVSKQEELAAGLAEIDAKIARIHKFHQGLVSARLVDSYEAAHAQLAVEYLAVTCERLQMLSAGRLKRLSGQSQSAADKSYCSTTAKLCEGLERTVTSCKDSEDAHQKQVFATWRASQLPPNEPAHSVSQQTTLFGTPTLRPF